MKKLITHALTLCCAAVVACSSPSGKGPTDTHDKGQIYIAVDESLAPVFQAEAEAYNVHYPKATITPIFCSEGEAINLLISDSVRLAVITRDLTDEEAQRIKDQKITPKSTKVAVDAVALITHPSNPDTALTAMQVGRLLGGQVGTWQALGGRNQRKDSVRLVFDKSSSSNVRFMSRHFKLDEAQLAAHVFAANSNEEVIKYVQNHPNALGFIGVNWVSDQDDSTARDFVRQVKVLGIADTSHPGPDDYHQPYQAYLALKKYPFRRDVKIISREARYGLGSGFMSFVAQDLGQRVILKAGLLPANAPIRVINLKNEDI